MAAAAARAEMVSGMSVVVNQDVITYGEIADRLTPLLQGAAQLYSDNRDRFEQEASRIRYQQIDDLVQRKLILHEFTANGYVTNVLEAFIDDQIKKNIQRDYYGDRARFVKTLHAQGMTYEMYREQQRENFIVNYMDYQNVDAPKKFLISPLKIEEYYQAHPDEFKEKDQVKVRMIVISEVLQSSAEGRKKMAEEILAQLDKGVPFVEEAKIYSADGKQTDPGERGWVDRSYFKPEIAKVAFSLKPGQHSGVIEQPEACYLLLVEDARPAHVKSLAEVRADIERTLKGEERTRLHKQWIERLRKKSFVQYY